MYSWVPDEGAGQVLVEAVGLDGARPARPSGVAVDEVVEGALGVEHRGRAAGRARARAPASGVLGSDSTPSASARRRAGSTVTTQARRRPGAASQGEGGRHGGLAHAAGAAADDHRRGPARTDERRRARPPGPVAAVTRRPAAPASAATPSASGAASRSSWSGPMAGASRAGRRSWGRGSSRPSRSTWAAASSRAAEPEGPRRLDGRRLAGRERRPRLSPAASRPAWPRPAGGSSQPFTTTGPSWTPALSSNRYAASTVSLTGISSGSVTSSTRHRAGSLQQLDHVGRLGPHRPAAGGVEQAGGRGEEGDGVAGGRGVHHDEVGHPVALELLDLAEDQDVADARDGRGHHVDDPRGDQPPGDPLEAVVGQVLEEGVVGGDAPAPDAAARGREQAGLLVAEGPGTPKAAPSPARPSSSTSRTERPASAAMRADGRGHRGLAHAALAGHHQHAALSAEGGDVHPAAAYPPPVRPRPAPA